MRRFLLPCAFVILAVVVVAPSASACEVCHETFDYASMGYCEYCIPVYCGYFSCNVRQYGGLDRCVGEHAGCFEYGGNCSSEPDDYHDPEHRDGPRAMNSDGPRLEDKWRLVRVQVLRKPASRRG